MAVSRPQKKIPWADSGSVLAPSDGLLTTGYTGPIKVGYRLWNWLFNHCMNGVQYLARSGMALWDTNTTYVVGDFVRDPNDLEIYQLRTLTGLNPALQPSNHSTNWTQVGMRLKDDVGTYGRPLFAFRDALNRSRWAIDHFGFPTGRFVGWQEPWDKSIANLFASGAKWTETENTGAIVNDIADNFRTMRVAPGPGASTGSWFQETLPSVTSRDDLLCTVSAPVTMDTVGANRTLIQFGIANTFLGATRGLFVGKSETDANWHFFSAEAGGIDTGVPPSANVFQEMRIEVIGNSVAESGSAKLAHLFIDGVLVATHTNALTSGTNVKVMFGAQTLTTGGAAVTTQIGPIDFRRARSPLADAVY